MVLLERRRKAISKVKGGIWNVCWPEEGVKVCSMLPVTGSIHCADIPLVGIFSVTVAPDKGILGLLEWTKYAPMS